MMLTAMLQSEVPALFSVRKRNPWSVADARPVTEADALWVPGRSTHVFWSVLICQSYEVTYGANASEMPAMT